MSRSVVSGFSDATLMQAGILNAITDVPDMRDQQKIIKLFKHTYKGRQQEEVKLFAAYFLEQYCSRIDR